MTKGIVWRFFMVLFTLWGIDLIGVGMHLTIVDMMILAVLLALFNNFWVWLLGTSRGLTGRTVVSWIGTMVSLYLGGKVLPHATVPPLAAITAGSILWIMGQLFPSFFGVW